MTKLEKDTDYLLRSIIDDKINFGLFTITYAARSMSLGVAMVILKQTNKQKKISNFYLNYSMWIYFNGH